MDATRFDAVEPPEGRFFEHAQQSLRVPVWRRLRADLETPVGAFLRLTRHETHAFLLESVAGGENLGRWTFLGVRPSVVLEARGEHIALTSGGETIAADADPLATLEGMLREQPPAAEFGLPPFTAGAVGFVAYDAVRGIEKLPSRAVDELQVPDAVLMFFDEIVVFDHVRHEMVLITHARIRRRDEISMRRSYEAAQRSLRSLERRLKRKLPVKKAHGSAKGATGQSDVVARTTREQYLAAVARAKEYIAAGDVFQVVLSQRFDFALEVEPFEVYRALRALNPSPYLFFLRMGDRYLLGSSPETLVRVTGDRIDYRPIAGTRRRSGDPAEDDRLAEEMRHDAKEVAEHVMLVDLGRNDVGRVSEYGSVHVKELMAVERYSHVMHLVSAIESTLRKDLTAMDALRACFPAGTLSGAPKVRAMEIIDELEPVRRGAYGGAVLYADARGNLDSCIAIRSMYVENGIAHVQAGAGIVADSVAESEHEECINKASAMLRAAETARSLA